MNDKAMQTIAHWHMLTRGDEVLVGVSGGADSVTLLHFLCRLRQDWGIRVRAAHINHNLRGAESLRDENFVRDLCGQWGVELSVCSLSPPIPGSSAEEWARTERYRFFAQTAHPGEKIATAHTLDDSAETQLLSLLRGTGLRGLGGIPPVRGSIIRPLIDCNRADIEDYCRRHHLTYITDSTNLTDDYTRNKLRHHVLPQLVEINPAYLAVAGRSLRILRAEESYLEAQAEQLLAAMTLPDDRYDRAQLLALPEVMALRVLRLLCRRRGTAWSERRLRLLWQTVQDGSGAVQLDKSCVFTSGAEDFAFVRRALEPAKQEPPLCHTVDLGGKKEWILPFYGKYIHILLTERAEFDRMYKSDAKLLKNALDYDRIVALVYARGRLPGDTFAPAGRGWTKKVKKLFNEAGIPPEKRAEVPLLAQAADHGCAAVWIAGFGVADGYGVGEKTEKVAVITVRDGTEPGQKTNEQ